MVCYTPNNVKEEQKFTYKNVGDVLMASRDYAAILIFSHGARDIDGTHYFCTGEIGSYGEKRLFVDGKEYKSYSTNIRAENNCILYLGVCDGLEKDKFKDSCPIIGYSGKTCMAQANAAILFDLLLKEDYTLKEAIDILPKEPEPNENTKVYCSTGVGTQKLEAKEEWKTEYNLRYSVDIKRAYNNYYPDDNTWEHLVYGKLSGVNESDGFFVRTRLYPVLYCNWWHNMNNVSPKSAIDENNLFKTVIDIDGMPEGIYKYRIEGTTYNDYFNDKYSFANIKPIKHRFAICSKNFKENSAELIPSRADYFTPMILDANGLSLEEISLPAGTTKKFTIDGYNGHTFKAISLKTNIADVSAEGNTLTVKGGVEGSTYIGVYDQQNLQMAVAKVTVTEGQAFDGQIVMERKYLVHRGGQYNSPEAIFEFDNGKNLHVSYIDTQYWNDRYQSKKGLYMFLTSKDYDWTDKSIQEWYISSEVWDEWVKEKIIINTDGRIQYYMNSSPIKLGLNRPK